jgi:glycosyltransferase involved in cell wall biosynthesis
MTSVFHVITTINRGGAENQLLVLAKEQVKQGLEVHILFLKGEPELLENFKAFGAIVHSDLQPYALAKFIKNYPPSIIHAHLPRAELVSLFTPANFKLVTTRHNSEPFYPTAPRWLSNQLSRLVERRASRIIGISHSVKKYLLDRGEVLKSENVEVVLYGYEINRPRDSRTNLPLNFISSLGTISRLANQKDLPTMILAFDRYLKINPGCTLTIVGSGPLETFLVNLCRTLKIEGSVHFLGKTKDVFGFLEKIDVFLLTSHYEGFGMVLLEAMDARIPIIASNASAIPEVLGEDFKGLAIPGDADSFFRKLIELNDFEFRKKVLAQQELRIGLFDVSKMSRRISDIYFS